MLVHQQQPELDLPSSVDLRRAHSVYHRPSQPETQFSIVTVQPTSALDNQKLDTDEEGDELDQEELDALEDEERVPISLVFLLVLGYIILGAFMFSIWEHWGPIEGAYFCFTTLTTIGFGDLVPGSAKLSDNQDGQTKFIICCAYMMVGLALIAMSFNLVQEEIVIKCRRIARRIGIMPSSGESKKFATSNRAKFQALWGSSSPPASQTKSEELQLHSSKQIV